MNKQEIVKSIENLERSIKSNKQFNKEHKKEITDNKAHNVEYKKEIKGLRVQLEELPKLDLNRWYTYDNCLVYLQSFDEDEGYYICYGWYGRDFSTGICIELDDDFKQATDKEAEEALIKEAKKRGFKEGVNVEGFNYTVDGTFWFNKEYNWLVMGRDVGKHGVIMKDGKWATIIKDKTVTLNGDYTKVQLTDLINNRF